MDLCLKDLQISDGRGLISRQMEPRQQRIQGPENPADPETMQQYVDYMILDPSRSSVHMQTPLLDPYSYRQVGEVRKHVFTQ